MRVTATVSAEGKLNQLLNHFEQLGNSVIHVFQLCRVEISRINSVFHKQLSNFGNARPHFLLIVEIRNTVRKDD